MLENKVMLVEDDPAVRMITRMALKREGFSVDEFSDGSYALNRLKELKRDTREDYYNAILSDIDMPILDGISLSRQCYDLDLTKAPIILMTGNRHEEVLPKNIVYTLQKPFSLNILSETLRNYSLK